MAITVEAQSLNRREQLKVRRPWIEWLQLARDTLVERKIVYGVYVY